MQSPDGSPLRQAARRIRRLLPDRGGRSAGTATEKDLRACYHLLLNRSPDPDGWAYWKDKLTTLTPGELAYEMLDSREFRGSPGFARLLETTAQMSSSEAIPTRVERDGLIFYVDPLDEAVGAEFSSETGYESHVTAHLLEQCAPGTSFADIGAHVGWYSVQAAARVGPAGRVVAFEPDPGNVDLLLRSANINDFRNLIALPTALSDRPDQAVLQRLHGRNAAIFPLTERDGLKTVGETRVPVLTLDIFSALFNRLDVVKVDVEGAELLVFRGGDAVLDRCRPTIFMELTPVGLERFPQSSVPHLGEWVREKRYRIERIELDGTLTPVPSIEATATYMDERNIQHTDLRLSPL